MRTSQSNLLQLAKGNVMEVRFTRKHLKPGWPPYRRMLLTNDLLVLQSAPGKIALHFRSPTHPPAYNWMSKGLVCVWDLFWQDYRIFDPKLADIVTVMPTRPPEFFWNYFNIYLNAMSPSEKIEFMKL